MVGIDVYLLAGCVGRWTVYRRSILYIVQVTIHSFNALDDSQRTIATIMYIEWHSLFYVCGKLNKNRSISHWSLFWMDLIRYKCLEALSAGQRGDVNHRMMVAIQSLLWWSATVYKWTCRIHSGLGLNESEEFWYRFIFTNKCQHLAIIDLQVSNGPNGSFFLLSGFQ